MSDMKLSEQLQVDHDCGDFGRALEGYAERARALEDRVEELERIAYPKYSDEFLAITDEIDRNLTSGG
jgi:hypothetical protein